MIKLNFGCGTNRLDDWQNYDADIDITKRLPFEDSSVDFVLCEHCVEHVTYYEAIDFFHECCRVLRPGGVARITVPSLEQIMQRADAEYCEFTRKWQNPKSVEGVRGAMNAILYAHGHRTAWTRSLLEATLYYAGFVVESHATGHSRHPELCDVEGHGKVIGDKFNEIESCTVEGTK